MRLLFCLVLFCCLRLAGGTGGASTAIHAPLAGRLRYASKLFGVELAKYGKYRADGAYVGVGAADDDEGRHVIEADGRDDDRANAAEAAVGAGGAMGFDVDGGTRWGGGARSLSGAATFHYTRSAENLWQTTLTRRRA